MCRPPGEGMLEFCCHGYGTRSVPATISHANAAVYSGDDSNASAVSTKVIWSFAQPPFHEIDHAIILSTTLRAGEHCHRPADAGRHRDCRRPTVWQAGQRIGH